MYNPTDIQFAGKHDYDKESAILSGWNKTFSVGIFQWVLASGGKRLKKSKAKVRVTGLTANPKAVFDVCESIVSDLDAGNWDGRKTVKAF